MLMELLGVCKMQFPHKDDLNLFLQIMSSEVATINLNRNHFSIPIYSRYDLYLEHKTHFKEIHVNTQYEQAVETC